MTKLGEYIFVVQPYRNILEEEYKFIPGSENKVAIGIKKQVGKDKYIGDFVVIEEKELPAVMKSLIKSIENKDE